jgi:hypothetical protein
MSDATSWHWCPECRLAASRPGLCPGCGRGYVPVPERGVPDEPFRPRPPRGGGALTALITTVVVLALLGGAAFGVVALYNGGAPAGADGQQVASVQGGSGGGSQSTYEIPPLNSSIQLPGSWSVDSTFGEYTADALSQVAAPVIVDLSLSSPNQTAPDASIGVVHVNTSTPEGSGSELDTLLISATHDASGGTIAWPKAHQITLAGDVTLAQDYILTYPSGAKLSGTFYAVAVDSAQELVVIQVVANQPTLLASLENAVLRVS